MPELANEPTSATMASSTPCLGLCTCPDKEVALAIATQLVEQKLAACVNMIPGVESVYRWQGKVHLDTEVQLLVKTHSDCLGAIEQMLQSAHPYDVPEWLVLSLDGGATTYLDWIKSSLK